MSARGDLPLRLALAGVLAAGVMAVLWAADGRAPAPGAGGPRAPSAALSARADLVRAGGDDPGARDVADSTHADDALRAGAREAAPETPETSAWRGRVLARADRRPIADARVVLALAGRDAVAHTDERGAFELARPVGLPAALSILHPEFVALRVPEPDFAREGLFQLTESARLVGRVTPWPPRGLQAGAASVATLVPHDRRRREPAGPRTAPLGADGVFAFVGVPPGAWNVAVAAPGAIVEPHAGIELRPGERRELALVARAGGRIAGVVRTAAGAPVAGVALEARAQRTAAVGGRGGGTVRAQGDARGAFELAGLAPGPLVLVARLPWGASVRRELAVPESLEPLAYDVEVAPPLRLSGRVVDARDAPVPGARVRALARGDRAALERALRGAEVGLATVADAAGAFAFDAVGSDERLTVLALPPAGADGFPGSVAAGPGPAPGAGGGEIAGVLVRLARGATLAGRVLGEDGVPPRDAEVVLRAVHQGASAPIATLAPVRTDSAGFFTFADAPAGAVVVQASAPGYRPNAARVELGPAGVAGVEIALAPEFRVTGRVVDADGAGVAGIAVRLALDPESAEAAALAAAGGRGLRSLAFSDAYGRVAFERLTRGSWIPSVHAADWELAPAEPAPVRVPDERDRLVLEVRATPRPALGVVAGEVWTSDGGELAGLRITGAGRGPVLVTAGERFELRGVEPAVLNLGFSADGRVPERRGPLELRPGQRLELGRIELAPGTRVTVRVRDADGRPVAGARVVLRPLAPERGGASAGRRTWRLDARANGAYRGAAIPRGAWQLRIAREGFRGHAQTLVVRAEDAQDATVHLAPAK
jgi:hypothetical protein